MSYNGANSEVKNDDDRGKYGLLFFYIILAMGMVMPAVVIIVANMFMPNSHHLTLWMFGVEVFALGAFCICHILELAFTPYALFNAETFTFQDFWLYILIALAFAIFGLFDLPYKWLNLPTQLQEGVSILITLMQTGMAGLLYRAQFPRDEFG